MPADTANICLVVLWEGEIREAARALRVANDAMKAAHDAETAGNEPNHEGLDVALGAAFRACWTALYHEALLGDRPVSVLVGTLPFGAAQISEGGDPID